MNQIFQFSNLTIRIPSLVLSIACTLVLTGCSSEFLRALDEANASMGGQRTCQYSRNKQTDQFDDFSITWGGYCNQWEVQVSSRTVYTLKCRFDNGQGRLYRNLYVQPRQRTEEISVAHMSQGFYYDCQRWSRVAFDKKRSKGLVLQEKMERGVYYNRVQNSAGTKRSCYIRAKQSSYDIVRQTLPAYGWTDWVRTGSKGFKYGCKRV